MFVQSYSISIWFNKSEIISLNKYNKQMYFLNINWKNSIYLIAQIIFMIKINKPYPLTKYILYDTIETNWFNQFYPPFCFKLTLWLQSYSIRNHQHFRNWYPQLILKRNKYKPTHTKHCWWYESNSVVCCLSCISVSKNTSNLIDMYHVSLWWSCVKSVIVASWCQPLLLSLNHVYIYMYISCILMVKAPPFIV